MQQDGGAIPPVKLQSGEFSAHLPVVAGVAELCLHDTKEELTENILLRQDINSV